MPSEVTLTKDEGAPWGFQLTGGATFEMPITVFDVEEGGHADKAGIRLGDVLVKINGMETAQLTLEQAHAMIDSSGNKINLAVTNLEDQEAAEKLQEGILDEEEEELVCDVSTLDLKPPRGAPQMELAQRKCWHPIMLDTSPPPIIEEKTGDEEAPHKKIMRNLRMAIDRKKIVPPKNKPLPIKPTEQDVDIEGEQEMSMEEQLRGMQRQLTALCALPAALQQSLTAVSQRIHRMLPPEPDSEPEQEEITEEDLTNEYITDDEYSTWEPISELEEVIEEESQQLSEYDQEKEPEPEIQPEPEPEPEPTQEELEKIEKLRKMKELNRAWPWGDNVKPVYKITDRYKVPHSELFSNKIQKMENKIAVKNVREIGD